jgi:hypothetical protein
MFDRELILAKAVPDRRGEPWFLPRTAAHFDIFAELVTCPTGCIEVLEPKPRFEGLPNRRGRDQGPHDRPHGVTTAVTHHLAMNTENQLLGVTKLGLLVTLSEEAVTENVEFEAFEGKILH